MQFTHAVAVVTAVLRHVGCVVHRASQLYTDDPLLTLSSQLNMQNATLQLEAASSFYSHTPSGITPQCKMSPIRRRRVKKYRLTLQRYRKHAMAEQKYDADADPDVQIINPQLRQPDFLKECFPQHNRPMHDQYAIAVAMFNHMQVRKGAREWCEIANVHIAGKYNSGHNAKIQAIADRLHVKAAPYQIYEEEVYPKLYYMAESSHGVSNVKGLRSERLRRKKAADQEDADETESDEVMEEEEAPPPRKKQASRVHKGLPHLSALKGEVTFTREVSITIRF